jgi:hypothetical protein
MTHVRKWLGVGLVAVFVAILAPLAFAQDVPSISVSDQAIQNNTVTVQRVWSSGDGWVVIHADNNGSPGAILGFTGVNSGPSDNVVVQLEGQTGNRLWAMLHIDVGVDDVFEFPGPDEPVTQLDGQPVMAWFSVTGGTQVQETATVTATVASAAPVTSTVAATVTTTAVVTGTPAAAGTPQTLPVTGGASAPWASVLLLVVGGLVAALGLGLAFARR